MAARQLRSARITGFTLILMLSGSALWSQEWLPYAEAGLGRKQGDFGSPILSTLSLGYATVGASGARWDANLTTPYLRLDRKESGVTSQEQGIGDLVAQGTYRFLPEDEEGWSLDGMGALKLPTASEAKGLGTGRTDVGGFLALHQQLGVFQWTALGGWIQGASSSNSELTSGAYVAGLSGAWQLDRNRWGLSFEARGPAYRGEPGAREISLDLFHTLSSAWAMKAMVTAGLTHGGPKQSVGLAFIHLFP